MRRQEPVSSEVTGDKEGKDNKAEDNGGETVNEETEEPVSSKVTGDKEGKDDKAEDNGVEENQDDNKEVVGVHGDEIEDKEAAIYW